MHAVFHRGRSMPRDRQTFRGFLVWMGVFCSSLSTGCLRSTILRQDDGPAKGIPTNSALAASTPAASTPSASVTPVPPAELQAAPTPVQDQAALKAATSPPAPANLPAAPPATEEAPADKPTPLLDAAIERVAAVTRQQRESLESSPPVSDPESVAKKAVASGSPAVVPVPSPLPAPPLSSPADTAEITPPVAPAVVKVTHTTPQPLTPADLKDALPPRTAAATKPIEQGDAKPEASPPVEESRGTLLDSHDSKAHVPAAAGDAESLAIGKLCLCRKIVGFGLFEPLREPRIKVGKRMLLYCEMTGMRYEPKEASFVSRLSSKIEIGLAQESAFQWTHELGPAEDVCASRRRDFFVNYVFNLPQTLPPGSYRLRLTQTDLVANRSTSAEIPLEIIP